MKRILILFLGLWLASPLSAQQLYQLWEKAGEEIIETEILYDYAFLDDNEIEPVVVTQNIGRWGPPEGDTSVYKEFAMRLEKTGLEYNQKNDTLCFVFAHTLNNGLSDSFISIQSRKILKHFERQWRMNEVVEVPYEYTDDIWEEINFGKLLDALYDGNTDLAIQIIHNTAIKKSIPISQIYGGYAWRIVIKDGEIVYPTQYWHFPLIY